MAMQFYASPEQIMRDRSEYARKGIARGRSVVVLTYAGGVLFVAENPPRALHKVSEIYDRIGFAAVGRYNEFENLRVGRRAAWPTCAATPTTGATSPAGRWPTPTRRPSARSSPSRPSRSRWRSASPRWAPTPADDELYRLTYDGSVGDEPGFVAMGGQAEAIANVLAGRPPSRHDARPRRSTLAVKALASVGGEGGSRASSRPTSSRWRCSTAPGRAARSAGSPGAALTALLAGPTEPTRRSAADDPRPSRDSSPAVADRACSESG